MKFTTASAAITFAGLASAAPFPESREACPAPGQYNSIGQYSCNPAHQYPEGTPECKLINGCYLIDYPNADKEPNCPAPGTYSPEGKYSCNPAHAYPEGQTCKLIDGCYVLESNTPPKEPDSIFAIKGFTERKPNGKDISTVFFNIAATNGGSLDFECAPYDAVADQTTDAFEAGKVYSCGKNSFFSFSYSPAEADGDKNELFLWQDVSETTNLGGKLELPEPVCRAGGAGQNDLVCSVPAQAGDQEIAMRNLNES